MRRPILAVLIYLCASPIASADFDSDDKEQPTLQDQPPSLSDEVSEGMTVPAATPLSDIPGIYRDGYGTYDGYRFAVVDGHGAIVDPHTRRIIGVFR
jgi:hypothetical protein